MPLLKPPNQFDFDAQALAITWKRRREEIELHTALALVDRSPENNI